MGKNEVERSAEQKIQVVSNSQYLVPQYLIQADPNTWP